MHFFAATMRVILGFLILCGAITSGDAQAASGKPNIIFILADDLGYGDLGCYGQKQIQTPNIDRLAAEGMRFTDFYAGSTVCAPSRCVLMTGLHTGHCFIRGNGRASLRPSDQTVAELLHDAGYRTALVGKWGLGNEGSTGTPNHKGFDYFYGYLDQGHAHNYYPTFLIQDEHRVKLRNVVPNEGKAGDGVASQRIEYSPELMLREALGFIDKNKERPFFLYFASILPHANNQGGRERGLEVPDQGIYRMRDWPNSEKNFAGMVTYLDMSVGRIMDKLKELGLDRDTYVFFSSDNGAHREGGQDPDFFSSPGGLRGIKRDLYEGGIRVPFIARRPGTIPAGKVSNHVGWFADFLPTAAAIAGVQAPKNLDGISLVPALKGDAAARGAEHPLYWEFYEKGSSQAVRQGPWKAVWIPMGGKAEIYELAKDAAEKHDLAAERPEVVNELTRIRDAAHVPSPDYKVSKNKKKN